MAFAGTAAAGAAPTGRGVFAHFARITGLTIAARVGAFAIGAADSGRLTTDQTPAANHTAIPAAAIAAGWPAEGAWPANAHNAILVTFEIAETGAGAVAPNLVGKRITAGNLELDFHNASAVALGAGDLVINILFLSTLIQ